jgi:hypothetical protein
LYLEKVHEALVRLNLDDSEIMRILIDQLQSPDTDTAVLAAATLGEMKTQDKDVVPGLIKCLESSQPTLRLQAIQSLKRLNVKDSRLDKIATDSIDWVLDERGIVLYVELMLTRPGENLRASLDRLLTDLRSDKSYRSRGHRQAVQMAIIALVESTKKSTSGELDAEQYIRLRLTDWLNGSEPQLRITANLILMGIGDTSMIPDAVRRYGL